MKKILYSFLWLFTVGGFLFLTSCDDTEDPDPIATISLSPAITANTDGSVSAAPGETVDVTVTFSGDGEVTAVSDVQGEFTNSDNTAATGETIGFIVPATADAGSTITLTFTLDGGVANEQLDIFVIYNSVADVVIADEELSTLETVVTDLGLASTLAGSGSFTVFAPDDDAFAAVDLTGLDNDDLTDIIQYHVIADSLGAGDFTTGWYQTLGDDSLYVEATSTGVTVNGIEVTTANLGSENGVVHKIGSVLVPNITFYEAFLLTAPDGDGNTDAFFSTSNGQLYSYSDVTSTNAPVSADIDLGYIYQDTNGATLASPDDGNWTSTINYDMSRWGTLNSTEFRETNLSTEAFDAIATSQGDKVEAEYEAGTALTNSSRVDGLAVDDVVAFSTTGGRFGLIKVVEVIGTFGNTDGIRIEVKVTN